MKPILSVCMIIKNEEKVLNRCFESIKGIADEIIVVDTGSQDQSKELALQYTDLVFDFEWVDDFSKARNYAASKAKGEWIFVIDADEFVDRYSFEIFKKQLKENPPKNNILSVQIVSFVGGNGEGTSLNYHDRLYKNDGTIAYYRNIHELLVHKDSKENKGIMDLQLYHSGYMTDIMNDKKKSKRNLLILLDNNYKKEPIDYFFIGNEYRNIGDSEKAIRYYQKAFNLKQDLQLDWVKKLLLSLTETLHKENRDSEALEVIETCEQIYLGLVDFKFYKGLIYFNQKKFKQSKEIFIEILSKKGILTADTSMDFLELMPLKYLGNIYEKENELQKAVQSYSKALSLNDADDDLWIRLIYLLAKNSTLRELTDFLNNNVVNKENMTPRRVAKILLAVPNLEVQKTSRSLINENELSMVEKESLLMKNLFLDNQLNDLISMLDSKNINEVIHILATGMYDINDLILLSLKANNIKYQEMLLNMKLDQSLTGLLKMLFKKKNKKLTSLEEDFFISIYRQSLVLGIEDVSRTLNGKKAFLSKPCKNRLNEIIQAF